MINMPRTLFGDITTGRLTRLPYLGYNLWLLVLWVLLVRVLAFVMTEVFMIIIIALPVLAFGLANLAVKRLRDIGGLGWRMLLALVVTWVIIFATVGKEAANYYLCIVFGWLLIIPGSQSVPMLLAVEYAMSRPQTITLFGSLLLAIGSYLPTSTAKVASRIGGTVFDMPFYAPERILTLILGVSLFLASLAYRGRPKIRYSLTMAVLAGVAGIIIFSHLQPLITLELSDSGSVFSIGSWIYVSGLGAILVMIGGLSKVSKVSPVIPSAPTDHPTEIPK